MRITHQPTRNVTHTFISNIKFKTNRKEKKKTQKFLLKIIIGINVRLCSSSVIKNIEKILTTIR